MEPATKKPGESRESKDISLLRHDVRELQAQVARMRHFFGALAEQTWMDGGMLTTEEPERKRLAREAWDEFQRRRALRDAPEHQA